MRQPTYPRHQLVSYNVTGRRTGCTSPARTSTRELLLLLLGAWAVWVARSHRTRADDVARHAER